MFTSVFLLNIVYFSVCLTSDKLYWIEDQLADVSTQFFIHQRVGVGELTGYLIYTYTDGTQFTIKFWPKIGMPYISAMTKSFMSIQIHVQFQIGITCTSTAG